MSRPPRFTLLNTWHDDNKGDSAIVSGTLTLLRERWPACRLGVVDILPEGHESRPDAHRHLLADFPDLDRAPSPMPMVSASRGSTRAGTALRFGGHLSRAASALLTREPNSQAGRLIASSDVVIANGGHYLHSHARDAFSYYRLTRLLYPVALAKRLGRPVVFFAHSVGPFDAVGRWMTRRAMANEIFVAREDISRRIAAEMGGAAAEVRLAPDAAFALTPDDTPRVRAIVAQKQLSQDDFVVITIRQWPHATAAESAATTESFIEQVARLVDRILARKVVSKVALVAHAIGPSKVEDDRIPTRALHARLRRDDVVMIDDDLSPRELTALYSRAKLLIGTRFHSVIFSMVGGTPALAISYYGPKAYGIMEMLGMKDACVDMNGFSADEAMRRLDSAVLGVTRQQVAIAVAGIRSRLELAVAAVAERMPSSIGTLAGDARTTLPPAHSEPAR